MGICVDWYNSRLLCSSLNWRVTRMSAAISGVITKARENHDVAALIGLRGLPDRSAVRMALAALLVRRRSNASFP